MLCCKFNEDYAAANVSSQSNNSSLPRSKWILPQVGALKLNTDVGYDRTREVASCGIVIRDHTREMILLAIYSEIFQDRRCD